MVYHNFGNLTRQYASAMLYGRPIAFANVAGSGDYPDISGKVWFYGFTEGTLVTAEIYGLPAGEMPCNRPVLAFHIHDHGDCSGTPEDPFANAGGHFNPGNCQHPYHAGDLPPLFSADGFAWCAFITNSFAPQEVIGRTIMIHSNPDDFHTQPSGNAGKKIACGVIEANANRPTPRKS